jgi:hypothetical protein
MSDQQRQPPQRPKASKAQAHKPVHQRVLEHHPALTPEQLQEHLAAWGWEAPHPNSPAK